MDVLIGWPAMVITAMPQALASVVIGLVLAWVVHIASNLVANLIRVGAVAVLALVGVAACYPGSFRTMVSLARKFCAVPPVVDVVLDQLIVFAEALATALRDNKN